MRVIGRRLIAQTKVQAMKPILIAAILCTATPSLADTCEAKFPVIVQEITDWSNQLREFNQAQAHVETYEQFLANTNAITNVGRNLVLTLKEFRASGCPAGRYIMGLEAGGFIDGAIIGVEGEIGILSDTAAGK
jgi:hypothetical protein